MALCLTVGSVTGRAAKPAEPLRYNVMANGYYAREAVDRDWHIKLGGEIPSLCGAYLIVHDAKGKPIYHGVVPSGKYTAAKPYTVTVKKDGVTGDYKIVMVGHQRDKLGLLAPWTDLPYEVYGGSSFSVGHDPKLMVYFKGPKGADEMYLGAYKGQLSVFDEAGKLVADTKLGHLHGRYDNAVKFKTVPGKTYQLKRKCFYFRSYTPSTFYLCFDADRWFQPSPELDKVKWWEIPLK